MKPGLKSNNRELFVFRLPWFIRRRLGLTSKYKIPFNRTVKMQPWNSAYMLADKQDIQHVLVKNAANYVKTPNLVSKAGRKRAGCGLLTSTGGRHKKLRRGLQPIFRHESAFPFGPTILERTDRMLDTWSDKQSIDAAAELTHLGLTILIAMIFGSEFTDVDDRFARAITARRRYNEYVINGRLPFRAHLPLPVVRRYRWAMGIIDGTIFNAIKQKRNNPGDDDFISMLMSVKLPDGSALNDRQIRDEVLTLTTAGYETASDGLTWTLHLLAKYPEAQTALREEIVTAKGELDSMGACPKDFPYMLATLAESWRIYPPTWLYVRTPLEDDVLPSGVKVSPGSILYLCPYLMHRHPEYFPNPEHFDPTRFADPTKPPPRFIYFPFGDGPHMCIGSPLAKFESVLVLASIIKRFRISPVPNHKVVPYAGVTLRPLNGVRIQLERYLNQHNES